jgi:hypothetical protein
MINSSIAIIGLIILNWNPVPGDDSACRHFYNELYKLPHSKLTLKSDGIVSLWDGRQGDGCEATLDTDEPKVSGKVVYQKYESIINWQGWSINEKLIADGPGSSTAGIEKGSYRCLVNWSQPSRVDENTGEIKQSDQSKIVVQCSTEQTTN